MRAGGASRNGTIARVLENAGWLLAGKGVGAALSLVYLGLATRTLGAAGFGQFVLILGIAQAIASFVGFQTWQGVVRFGMPHLQAGRRDSLGGVLALALALDFGGALAGCLIAIASIGFLGNHFGWDAAVRTEALLFAFVILLSVRSTAIGVLRLHDRFGMGATADTVTPIVRLIGAGIAVAAGASIKGFLIAWAASEIATAAVYWWFAAKVSKGTMSPAYWPKIGRVGRDNPGILKFVLITNANTTLGGAAKQVTVLLVGFFAGAAAAGHYRLAHQLGEALARVSEMLSRSVYAELTRVHFNNMGQNIAKLFRSSVRLAAIGAAVIIVLMLLIGKPALTLIAGPQFADAYPLLMLLGTAAALGLGGTSFEPALMATGRAGLALQLRFVSTAVLAGLLALLLPHLGATGAGIATLVSAGISLLLFGAAAWRVVHKDDAKKARNLEPAPSADQ
ncbi:lipopolysaccharide biosynthesis protein [Allosphingosinicella flava]|uniref:Lipopolysaccharide biosynthesis protein n=1 Tax=Allosphingosinicella flava TaxID=2771430 RepID=A0A7T2LL83_9SPHN|nr:lipopolysaccharide biosynthesis protein [Sphingosinicella flava]QPQ54159.1 lipopolysaccharide biosynthesis protein [Sphingosinicella flava]